MSEENEELGWLGKLADTVVGAATEQSFVQPTPGGTGRAMTGASIYPGTPMQIEEDPILGYGYNLDFYQGGYFTYKLSDFQEDLNNYSSEELQDLAYGMYAEGLYAEGVELSDVLDPNNMASALSNAVFQAQRYAEFFENDPSMTPTATQPGGRFTKYRNMTPQQIMDELAKRRGTGGVSIRLPDPAQLQEVLNNTSPAVLGRKPTKAEIRMFVAGINAAVRSGQSVDVRARAVGFAREQAPVEAGAMDLKNAGNLVLQALGMG